jgi:hypothetical protein
MYNMSNLAPPSFLSTADALRKGARCAHGLCIRDSVEAASALP